MKLASHIVFNAAKMARRDTRQGSGIKKILSFENIYRNRNVQMQLQNEFFTIVKGGCEISVSIRTI